MISEIEELHKRVDKIERQKSEEVLALVEILSNATFFGEMKKLNCEFAKNGQCGFFFLDGEENNKIPIFTECRIKGCQEPSFHLHIELSNISCTLCQRTVAEPEMECYKLALEKAEEKSRNNIDVNRKKTKVGKVGKQK